jgi:tetratricopeptide (TPR) repeat protein
LRRIAIAALVTLGVGTVWAGWAASARAANEPPATDVYRAILRSAEIRSPSDTLGNGVYAAAKETFYDGKFDEAVALAKEFTKTYTRNLNMNDALELTLLARGFRDFQDEPLRAYAKVMALREAGRPDSAAAVAARALERWPGARVRYHLHYQIAEIARDRGDHAAAIEHAMAVADSSSKSRLAPAALKLAGDETLALGQGPERALKLYQELLERFPTSPLTPGVRSQVLEMRKNLQL